MPVRVGPQLANSSIGKLFEVVMFRLAVTVCLVLTSVAGPFLCCCTVTPVLAGDGSVPTTTWPDGSHHGHRDLCCQPGTGRYTHFAQGNGLATSQSRHDSDRSLPPLPCTCEETGAKPAILVTPNDVTRDILSRDAHYALDLLSGLAVPIALPVTITPIADCGRDPALPFYSCTDLLRVFHLLRC